jgi:hypothetical protein
MARYFQIVEGEPLRIPMRGFRHQCCDCGLVHDVDFKSDTRRTLETRWRINPRATAAVRRARKLKKRKP